MTTLPESITVHAAFLQPLHDLAGVSVPAPFCPQLSDEDWRHLGIERVLQDSKSGRGFLQEHGPRLPCLPSRSNYFSALAHERRGDSVRAINRALLEQSSFQDRLGALGELARYECFALDGHWHQAAAHDLRHNGAKRAVGHFYSLDLRGHQLRHLTAAEGLHEHDMSALKRLQPKGLRQDVPKGRRVLIVYDKAGIDLDYWRRCRIECAVYFLSRIKEGMVYDWIEDRPLGREDARHAGVQSDRLITMNGGHPMRLITYVEPEKGKEYQFLTNVMDVPAGVLVELYRRRWDIEKVFDEIKNKLGEKKAWGTSLGAKANQGQFVALTHNLLLLYEQRLERERQIHNQAEDQRRSQRQVKLAQMAQREGRAVSSLLLCARTTTQRSVKFIRWLRHALQEKLTEAAAVPRLQRLYATL